MSIPSYPEFAAITLDMRTELHPLLRDLPDGVSEFTFAGLYLFRKEYSYEISRCVDGTIIGRGKKNGRSFAILPQGLPGKQPYENFLSELLETYDYIRGVSSRVLHAAADSIRSQGLWAVADRDNYDYLYDHDDMAELSGKKFHKKRNLIHNFARTYPEHETLTYQPEHAQAALEVLNRWRNQVQIEGDYPEALEAIELQQALELTGNVACVNGVPAAFSLGETLSAGSSYVIHIEKGDHELKGIYQYIFRELVRSLPDAIRTINREQDVGDPGLRQAKMTYRPVNYTRKFQLWNHRPPDFPPQAVVLSPRQTEITIPDDSLLEETLKPQLSDSEKS